MTSEYCSPHTIRVRTAQPYDVVIGRDLTARLPDALGLGPAAPAGQRKVALIHPPQLAARAAEVGEALRREGGSVWSLPIPDAEAGKTPDVAAHCWSELGRAGFTRADAVVSVGGGATTDLAGFVAGTWMRGISVVHLPTTLLAMVDAAVGGKTGINTATGKNLVGVIHEPAAVLCDLAALETLPPADLAAGSAEIVKAGFIRDRAIVAAYRDLPTALLDPAAPELFTAICRAIQVKADVVAGDLHETSRAHGGREILNYGHTLGHAIERCEGYRWRHGAAVSVGMVFAAELANLAGHLSADDVALHRRLLSSLGLPISYDGDWGELQRAMAVDKKARGAQLRFVILAGLGSPVFLDGPDPALLAAAYERIRH